jgi:hypothetical protein
MRDHIGELTAKELTRREFLATLGVGLISIMGLSSILKLLSAKGHAHQLQSSGNSRSYGYGTSAYGR